MNKHFFAVLLIIFFTTCYAHAQFNFGVRAGFNCTKIWHGESISTIMKSGLLFGAVAEYSVNNKFSITSGIIFATQGYKNLSTVSWDGIDNGGTNKVKDVINLNYIQIPIHVRYKPDNRLLLWAGPYFGFAVGGKEKSKWFEDGKKKHVFVHRLKFGGDDYSNYRIFDFGLNVGIAKQFSNIQVGLEGNNSLISITKSSTYNNDSAYNFGIALSVTYMFGK